MACIKLSFLLIHQVFFSQVLLVLVETSAGKVVSNKMN